MNDPKTVQFLGIDHTVPKWVQYVAQDKDGTINGYEHEPHLIGGWYWGVNGGRVVQIFRPGFAIVCEKV